MVSFFEKEFQFMASASDDSSLSSKEDIKTPIIRPRYQSVFDESGDWTQNLLFNY